MKRRLFMGSAALAMPIAGQTQPAPSTGRRARTFVLVHGAWNLAAGKTRVRGDAGWRMRTLDTDHDAMVTAPAELTRLLIDIAA